MDAGGLSGLNPNAERDLWAERLKVMVDVTQAV
jgi:hypothetical protein